MNFKLELPRGTILLNRSDLKVVLEELLGEIQDQEAEDEIMTIKEAAEYLKVSVPTIRNMIAAREIPFFQKVRFSCMSDNLIKCHIKGETWIKLG